MSGLRRMFSEDLDVVLIVGSCVLFIAMTFGLVIYAAMSCDSKFTACADMCEADHDQNIVDAAHCVSICKARFLQK